MQREDNRTLGPEVKVALSRHDLNVLRGEATPAQTTQMDSALLHLLLENTSDLVFWKDKNLVYRGCNHAFARAVGLRSPAYLLGKTDAELLNPELADTYRDIDMDVLASDLPYISHDFVLVNDRGEELRWVRTYKFPIKNEQGEVLGIMGIVRDDRHGRGSYVPKLGF